MLQTFGYSSQVIQTISSLAVRHFVAGFVISRVTEVVVPLEKLGKPKQRYRRCHLNLKIPISLIYFSIIFSFPDYIHISKHRNLHIIDFFNKYYYSFFKFLTTRISRHKCYYHNRSHVKSIFDIDAWSFSGNCRQSAPIIYCFRESSVVMSWSLGIVYRLDKMWPHPGDGPSDDSSNGSSYYHPHTESTAGQPSGLLRLVGDLQWHSRGELTTMNKCLTEPLGTLISEDDDKRWWNYLIWKEKLSSRKNFCRNSNRS
jgi:hypothetical protein